MSLYGLIISLAILVCILVAEKRTQNKRVWDVALVCIVSGLIGARIYHVVDFWPYYSQNPLNILYFWHGGLGIWGAIIATIVGIKLWFKKDSTYWLDVAASVVPLGQAIGRFGNYFNQENFGYPTFLPWGIFIDPQNRPQQFSHFEKFHPLFLYESLLNLGLFFVLKKFKPGNGQTFRFYLIGYSAIRFFLEFLRVNPWKVYGVNVAQTVCLVVGLTAWGFVVMYKRDNINT